MAKHIKSFVITMLLVLTCLAIAACNSNRDGNAPVVYAGETPTPTPQPQPTAAVIEPPSDATPDTPQETPAPTPTPTPATPRPTPMPTTPRPYVPISAYGRQVAEEFLSGMTTIFTGIFYEQFNWSDGTSRGSFTGWDRQTQQGVIVYEPPGTFLGVTGEINAWGHVLLGFFDRYGNRIYNVPWLHSQRFEGVYTPYGESVVSYANNYANYFRLFNFDNNGIPVILVHFNQTFDGGYAGFYRIFRYVDGQYRMLEMRSYNNGEETQWPWLGSFHEFFYDNEGRIITFISSEYGGLFRYEHLVLTDHRAELHLITEMTEYISAVWQAWHEHHWEYWPPSPEPHGHRERADSWIFHNPAIFGTNIPLTLFEPLTALEDEIFTSIASRSFP